MAAHPPGAVADSTHKTLSDRKDLVQKLREAPALSWKKLFSGTERIFYLGETHNNASVAMELANSMAEFKDAGITHLGLELGYDKNRQEIFDRYCRDGSCRDEVFREYVDKRWGEDAARAQRELLIAAPKAGIKLVLLDLRRSESEAENFVVLPCRPKETMAEFEQGQAEKCGLKQAQCQSRDCHMAFNIERVLQDSTVRLVFLVGSYHARKDTQPLHLLKLYGLSSKAYSFIPPAKQFQDALEKAGRKGQRLFFPTNDPYEGFILIPEVLKEEIDDEKTRK